LTFSASIKALLPHTPLVLNGDVFALQDAQVMVGVWW